VDNQLPEALARFLAGRGVDCSHVLNIGLGQASDRKIWGYAAEHSMVLISKDEDFLYMSVKEMVTVRLVWIRLGNCRNRDLLLAMEQAWFRIESRLNAGDRVVEVR
jgi:predicted nuclease of predicted toxin-antitoxin system